MSLLPTPAQSRIQTQYPEWFLPRTIIMKETSHDQNEIGIYSNLVHLRGTYILRPHGVVTVCGSLDQALLLSYIEGTPPDQLTPDNILDPCALNGNRCPPLHATSDFNTLQSQLLLDTQMMYSVLTLNRGVHGHLRLDNFIWVDGSIVAAGFGHSRLLPQATSASGPPDDDNIGGPFRLIKQVRDKFDIALIQSLHEEFVSGLTFPDDEEEDS